MPSKSTQPTATRVLLLSIVRDAISLNSGAAKNRFDCKHLNKGCAAGYIAKYIAKTSTATRWMVSAIMKPMNC